MHNGLFDDTEWVFFLSIIHLAVLSANQNRICYHHLVSCNNTSTLSFGEEVVFPIHQLYSQHFIQYEDL